MDQRAASPAAEWGLCDLLIQSQVPIQRASFFLSDGCKNTTTGA